MSRCVTSDCGIAGAAVEKAGQAAPSAQDAKKTADTGALRCRLLLFHACNNVIVLQAGAAGSCCFTALMNLCRA